MNPRSVDFLIVGQGLAGSLLAWQLIRRHRRVLVVDDQHSGAASLVAAGLVNPITGMRMVKTVGVDRYLPAALRCYRELAEYFGQPFYHPRPLLRLFSQPQQREQWVKRRSDPAYQRWLQPGLEQCIDEPIVAPFGGFRQRHAGYLDIPALLRRIARWLDAQDSLQTAQLESGDCRILAHQVQWKDIRAKRLIVCNGHRAHTDTWFDWLPFQVVKGEILSLESLTPLPRLILNRGRWLLPVHDHRYRLGASYDRLRLDLKTTRQAHDELLRDLANLVRRPDQFRVTAQQAGIRPATLDTQPFVGWHPRLPRLGLFNGFGSKGSLLIPWHAERFARHLDGLARIPAHADIHRYANRESR